jgi:hypothetical protein
LTTSFSIEGKEGKWGSNMRSPPSIELRLRADFVTWEDQNNDGKNKSVFQINGKKL